MTNIVSNKAEEANIREALKNHAAPLLGILWRLTARRGEVSLEEEEALKPFNYNGGKNLSGLDLSELDIDRANLAGINLSGSNLQETNLVSANLTGANLSYANLHKTNFTEANFSEAILTGANLSEAILKNVELDLHNLSNLNLSGANLTGTDFSNANLSGTKLSGAIFNQTNLFRANLYGTDLSGIRMSEIDIKEAVIINANLNPKMRLNNCIKTFGELANLLENKMYNNQPISNTRYDRYHTIAIEILEYHNRSANNLVENQLEESKESQEIQDGIRILRNVLNKSLVTLLLPITSNNQEQQVELKDGTPAPISPLKSFLNNAIFDRNIVGVTKGFIDGIERNNYSNKINVNRQKSGGISQ